MSDVVPAPSRQGGRGWNVLAGWRRLGSRGNEPRFSAVKPTVRLHLWNFLPSPFAPQQHGGPERRPPSLERPSVRERTLDTTGDLHMVTWHHCPLQGAGWKVLWRNEVTPGAWMSLCAPQPGARGGVASPAPVRALSAEAMLPGPAGAQHQVWASHPTPGPSSRRCPAESPPGFMGSSAVWGAGCCFHCVR